MNRGNEALLSTAAVVLNEVDVPAVAVVVEVEPDAGHEATPSEHFRVEVL